MSTPATPEKGRQAIISRHGLMIALICGLIALAMVRAQLTIPIPGTPVVTDPRETAVTIGAAVSGPIGGILIGLLAGAGVPRMPLASILAHVVGSVGVGLLYKPLYYHLPLPRRYAGWAGLIFIYYYGLLIPAFMAGMALFYDQTFDVLSLYYTIGRGAFPEMLITAGLTTLVWYILPKQYQQPAASRSPGQWEE